MITRCYQYCCEGHRKRRERGSQEALFSMIRLHIHEINLNRLVSHCQCDSQTQDLLSENRIDQLLAQLEKNKATAAACNHCISTHRNRACYDFQKQILFTPRSALVYSNFLQSLSLDLTAGNAIRVVICLGESEFG